MNFDFYWPKKTLKNDQKTIKNDKKEAGFDAFFNKKIEKNTIKNENKQILNSQKKQIIESKKNNTISEMQQPISEKQQLLNQLKDKKKADKSLIFANQENNFVFDDGNIYSKIMLIGEAPGEEEDKQQKPFVGKSGQLLRCFLKEAKIVDFYITNIVSWRPPNNRTPTNEEIEKMKPYILEHIKIIEPKIIVTIGTTALKALDISETITKAQGNIFTNNTGKIFPIYHPSYALRVTSKKKELWISLLKLYKICN